jgi:type III pantothenate kinase
MNLVVDFGNTRIKAGVFKETQIQKTFVFASEAQLIDTFQNDPAIKNCLIASVTQAHEITLARFSSNFNTALFSAHTPIPLINKYTSALTLGSDRMAAAVGSFSLYPNQNVLTIDAGTCIKYNFVNAQNDYLGGAISPGISMRLKAMNQYTSALPLVPFNLSYHQLIGTSTQESLLSGALIASACEVDGMIQRYKEEYDDLLVLITGGDADYLCKQVKNRFFAHQNLLLQGLNTILNYNLEK